MPKTRNAKFSIGQRIYHKLFFYRGVIFNVDAEFSGDEQWYDEIPLGEQQDMRDVVRRAGIRQ